MIIAYLGLAGILMVAVLLSRRLITKGFAKKIHELYDREHEIKMELQAERQRQHLLNKRVETLNQRATLMSHGIAEVASSVPGSTQGASAATSADWLLKNGHITTEQYSKALKRSSQLRMDFASTCLTLDYIDKPTAEEAQHYPDPGKPDDV